MRITKNGNWAQDWNTLNGITATSYYRKADIVKSLRYFGFTGEEKPEGVRSRFADVWFLIGQQVAPYRVTYSN